tara:strand:+ start:172 stop:522 length:351 start_codon:yes stop_codon:yes gene_type:complete
MENSFKHNSSFDKRLQESIKITNKYPDRIPIIVEKFKTSELPIIDKSKYLVPKSMKVSQFYFVIRQRIKLNQNQALFMTVDGLLLSANDTIGDVYENMKHNDGFLYMIYTGENTFG